MSQPEYVRSPRVGIGRKPGSSRQVDPVVVSRLMDGDLDVQASWWELHTAITDLLASGLTQREVAVRIGVTRETVCAHNRPIGDYARRQDGW